VRRRGNHKRSMVQAENRQLSRCERASYRSWPPRPEPCNLTWIDCFERVRRNLSAAAEDLPGDGQDGAGAAVPLGHAAEAVMGRLQKCFVEGLLVLLKCSAKFVGSCQTCCFYWSVLRDRYAFSDFSGSMTAKCLK
jgi:hypothetical protein